LKMASMSPFLPTFHLHLIASPLFSLASKPFPSHLPPFLGSKFLDFQIPEKWCFFRKFIMQVSSQKHRFRGFGRFYPVFSLFFNFL
jgi:hypothetical protein